SGGVFLSGATLPPSSGRWPLRRARRRAVPAFGNSSPTRSAPSRRAPGDSARRTPDESGRPPEAASRDRSGTRPAGHRESTTSGGGASWRGTVVAAVPGWGGRPVLEPPFADTPATSERRNSRPLPPDGRRSTGCGPTSTAEQRGDGASPVAGAFRE